MKLQSRFGHGDRVSVNLYENGILTNGKIEAVAFSEAKVYYSVGFEITRKHGDEAYTSCEILEGIDSALVKPFDEKQSVATAGRLDQAMELLQYVLKDRAEQGFVSDYSASKIEEFLQSIAVDKKETAIG